MEKSKAALVSNPPISEYPCGHPLAEGREFCPQCCYMCGHPRGGPVHLIGQPTLMGLKGIELTQCLSREPVKGRRDTWRVNQERCNLIIDMCLITPTIIM